MISYDPIQCLMSWNRKKPRKVPLTNLHGSKLWRGSTCVIHGMLVCCVIVLPHSKHRHLENIQPCAMYQTTTCAEFCWSFTSEVRCIVHRNLYAHRALHAPWVRVFSGQSHLMIDHVQTWVKNYIEVYSLFGNQHADFQPQHPCAQCYWPSLQPVALPKIPVMRPENAPERQRPNSTRLSRTTRVCTSNAMAMAGIAVLWQRLQLWRVPLPGDFCKLIF